MQKGFFKVPPPINEVVLNYAPNSEERKLLKLALAQASNKVIEIPMYIGKNKVFTDIKCPITPPHNHQHVIANFNYGDNSHVSGHCKTTKPDRKFKTKI